MIPKEKIEEVKDRASIVSVISEYMPLKKRGANHIGLCPFHSEKTPSFSVNEEKRIFYCFGCHETGNVISFVMKKEGVEFPEAVKMLAARYGITIEETRSAGPDPRDAIFAALKSASDYFTASLMSEEGKAARDYLKKRGYGRDTAQRYLIGYAPNAWEGLSEWLRKRNVPTGVAESAGLLTPKKGGHYDKFRNRLIFPIHDLRGRIAGFGGRAMADEAQGPKYLNSPESPVFKKSEILYGFHLAKQEAMKKGEMIIVEGYFDLIAMQESGILNCAATMGTALTPEHLRMLKNYAKTVYVLFDSDEAGRNAAVRTLGLSLEEEVFCRAVTLPQGKDPDEYLAVNGADKLRSVIAASEPLMYFYLRELQRRSDIKKTEGRAAYLNGAVEYLLRVKNQAERGDYAAHVSAALGLPLSAVYEAMKTGSDGARFVAATGRVLEAENGAAVRDANPAETTIVKVIIKHPDLIDESVMDAVALFKDEGLREAGIKICSMARQSGDLNAEDMIESLGNSELKKRIAGYFMEEKGFIEDPEKMLRDSLKRVANRGKIKTETATIIKKLEEQGRSDLAQDILKRIRKPGGSGE